MSTDVHPVTFYVPSSAGEPIDVKVAHSGLRMVILSSGEIQVGERLFKSLSGAAKAVSGNSAEAGWAFWAIESDGRRVTLAELRARLLRRPEAG